MSDGISAVSGLAEGPMQVRLDAIVSDQEMNAHKSEAVSHSVDRALSKALHLPGAAPEVTAAREEVLNGGKARLEKAAILTEIDPSALSTEQAEMDKQMDVIVDRVKKLYGELTTWQVAWGISHRVQQDTSQLLKGQ